MQKAESTGITRQHHCTVPMLSQRLQDRWQYTQWNQYRAMESEDMYDMHVQRLHGYLINTISPRILASLPIEYQATHRAYHTIDNGIVGNDRDCANQKLGWYYLIAWRVDTVEMV